MQTEFTINQNLEILQEEIKEKDNQLKNLSSKLHKLNSDMALIRLLNDLSVRKSIDEIMAFFTEAIANTFNCFGTTLYYLNKDGSCLNKQKMIQDSFLISNIKKIINLSFDDFSIPISEGGLYSEVLSAKSLRIITEESEIMQLIQEHTMKNSAISETILKLIRKFTAHKMVILTPIVLNNNSIGLLSMSLRELLNKESIERLQILMHSLITVLERKLSEKLTIQSQEKIQEVSRSKSNFLINMSHEIRTPINSIIGFSDLLRKQDFSQEKKETFIDIIKKNSESLLQLFSDIIDFSKIESHQLKFKYNNININSFLSEILITYDYIAQKQKNKTIDINYKKDNSHQDSIMETDGVRLRQIFTNILGNAVKFTDNGRIEFGCQILENGKDIQFYVKDTGRGIPKEKFDVIFDRFKQINDDDDFMFKGTGLGLSISKSLIELMGGNIWVESEINKGSCFYFTLPLRQKTEYNRNSIKPGHKNQNILIVEDDECSYHYILNLLDGFLGKIHWEKNGDDALKAFKKDNYDLVLMDIRLPGMDGYETSKKIKEIRNSIPIIVQTAYTRNDEQERCTAAGCNHLITKPIISENLINVINLYIS